MTGGLDVYGTVLAMWDSIFEIEKRFPPAAYVFVQEGLRQTSDRVYAIDDDLEGDGSRHVTGQELCVGLRDYAVGEFGPLAITVLNSWGIRKTRDFGSIVFTMVEAGLLRKTDDDSLDDFVDVFEFDEAFPMPIALN